ncbi:MAG: hypothetical protein EOO52_14670 [Gammaproteobacteria bacterium]|nr:MAG: hypothetical protein EOO52_14670 [Gammaproteobacteria bacterium]
MKWYFVFISFLVGLLSLGEEIVWVRIVSFLGHSVPQSFSFVLFCYISGIAIGALLGPKLLRTKLSPLLIISNLLLFSAVLVLAAPWIIKYFTNSFFLVFITAFLIFACAGFKGAIFPLVHHWFSLPGENLGRTLSWVYCANLLGSAMGPLLVGFWLLDAYSMFSALELLGSIELTSGISILLFSVSSFLKHIAAVVCLIISTVVCALLFSESKNVLKTVIAEGFPEHEKISHVIENRHGVIFTLSNGKDLADAVYGGNVYDGSFNIDLVKNTNKIDRAYILAALQPQPRRALFIGLSSASWLRVVSAMPGVENIDVVEINKGYSTLVNQYPGANDIFNDRRINFFYTDGRQLVQKAINENKKYDLIVMNNTWHWRIYSTNLLSIEFMGMLKKVMNKGAVTTFNSTDSLDVVFTAKNVFDKVYMYRNFVYVSDRNLSQSLVEYKDRLCSLSAARVDGQNCGQPAYHSATQSLSSVHLLEWEEIPKAWLNGRSAEVITDDNMITEYRFGSGFSM